MGLKFPKQSSSNCWFCAGCNSLATFISEVSWDGMRRGGGGMQQMKKKKKKKGEGYVGRGEAH